MVVVAAAAVSETAGSLALVGTASIVHFLMTTGLSEFRLRAKLMRDLLFGIGSAKNFLLFAVRCRMAGVIGQDFCLSEVVAQ